MPDWSKRYGNRWKYRDKARKAHQKLKRINNLCAYCMTSKATQLHHTQYGVDEELGINWFGVCDRCHLGVCHSKQHWIKHKQCPELLNHNTPEFIEQLQFNFKLMWNGKD